jgi:hypothetical protein
MEPHKDMSQLTPAQRARRYRALADDAQRLAARAASESIRDSYALMTQQWLKLAEEAETLAKLTET